VEIEIAGRLTALLGETTFPNGVEGVWGRVVAEERYRHSPQIYATASGRALEIRKFEPEIATSRANENDWPRLGFAGFFALQDRSLAATSLGE
jgi:hypothetical protein